MAGGVRTVARLYLVLGLAAASFALYAISLDPATPRQLQVQMIKEMDLQQLEQGLVTACAARAAEAMKMRADAVMLLLFALGQAVAAIAKTGRLGIFCTQMQSIATAWNLLDVLAIGRCHGTGTYHRVLSVCYLFCCSSTACSSSSASRSSTVDREVKLQACTEDLWG